MITNETLKVIKSRRSVRKYTTQKLTDEQIETLIDAAKWSPSGHNDQSWHFTVITNPATIAELNTISKIELLDRHAEWMVNLGKSETFNVFYSAPAVIVIAALENAVSPHSDACAAAQNILLAAESMGLGSCWLGLASRSDAANKLLNIPDGYKVFYSVSVGYCDGPKPNAPARKEIPVAYFK